MLCFSIVLWLRRLGKSAPIKGGCGGSAAQDVAPRCGARAVKSLKTGSLGARFEAHVRKICTMLRRESYLEVKNC